MDRSKTQINLNVLTVVLLVLASYIFQYSTLYVNGVVVDGEKKKDISPTKKQSAEKDMIDSFNIKTCGMSDPSYTEHEFVNMAREGQFPWMVSFQIKVPNNVTRDKQRKLAKKSIKSIKQNVTAPIIDLHFCCGSMISDRWILTAAHCFAVDSIKNYIKTNKIKVVIGSTKVSSRDSNNMNATIKRIYYHSSFDRSMPVGFDIALVELNSRVNLTQKRSKNEYGEQNKPFVNTICLPRSGRKYNTSETARIAGWGLSSEKDVTSMPSKLLTTDIMLQDKHNCTRRYAKILRSNRPYGQQRRYDDFLCANYKNSRDACQSDSGGPLMQYSNGKAVVVGIVSYGVGCAKKGVPGLYTRTSAYINWIKDITKHGPNASVEFKLIQAPRRRKGYLKKRPSNSKKHSITNKKRRPTLKRGVKSNVKSRVKNRVKSKFNNHKLHTTTKSPH